MTNVRHFFNTQTNHRPDEAVYEALEGIPATLESMTYGIALPKVYLSSLDPGSGKTVAITQFVKCLIKRSTYKAALTNVGVIILLSRLEEIETMVKAMDLQDDQYACLTSEDDINALGLGENNIDKAQVLFTTQQRRELQIKGKSFGEAEGFYFNGRVRSVRIWDESYLPGESIVILEYDIRQLSGAVGKFGKTVLSDALLKISDQIRMSKSGDVVELPDFASLIDTSCFQLIEKVRAIQEDLGDTMASLCDLSGGNVSIHRDGGDHRGIKAISFKDTLPVDLMPILVTDASGRVRHTYALMDESRQNIVRLKTAEKTYSNLTVAVLGRSGAKSSWERNASELTAIITETINAEPDKKWLIVGHKPRGKDGSSIPDLSDTLPPMLSTGVDIKFLTWGKHSATNEYNDRDRIVLAGTLFYSKSQYEGLTRLSGNIRPCDRKVSTSERNMTDIGESKHNILQAISRGILRGSKDGDCHPCKVFIIASARSGIKKALTMPEGVGYDPSYIFPGCKIEPWRNRRLDALSQLKGYMKATYDYLERWVGTVEVGAKLKLKELRGIVGARDHKSFNSLLQGSTMVEALENLGICLHQPNAKVLGIVKV